MGFAFSIYTHHTITSNPTIPLFQYSSNSMVSGQTEYYPKLDRMQF